MRLFLDWITSINLSAASYNNNASLFSLSFFSPSRHRFHFIDANPARSSSSIPMMLVSSVCNRLCVLSLSLSLSFFLPVLFSVFVCVWSFWSSGGEFEWRKAAGCYMIKRFFFIRHAFFFSPVFSLFIGRYANISENTSATTATTTTRKAKGGYAVLCYLDNDDSSHAHRPAGFMSSLLPRAPELTWPVGQNIY
jgi:hypothetical protein